MYLRLYPPHSAESHLKTYRSFYCVARRVLESRVASSRDAVGRHLTLIISYSVLSLYSVLSFNLRIVQYLEGHFFYMDFSI